MNIKARIEAAAFWELDVCTKCWTVQEETEGEPLEKTDCCDAVRVPATFFLHLIEDMEAEDTQV